MLKFIIRIENSQRLYPTEFTWEGYSLESIKVLLTVGTTPFEQLIKCFDVPMCGIELTMQTGNSSVAPTHHNWVAFTNDLESLIERSDLVITHAGAGTVYNLLERQKRCIVIPNLERNDKHQSELADYVRKKKYAYVCSIEQILQEGSVKTIKDVMRFTRRSYQKEEFFGEEQFINYFLGVK